MANVEVHINNKVAVKLQTLDEHSVILAGQLFDHYHIDELKQCGVDANVYITGIESRMNGEGFVEQD